MNDAASDTIPTDKQPNTAEGVPSTSGAEVAGPSARPRTAKPTSAPEATPEAIAAAQQQLHARILRLSEELCEAADHNDTERIAALQPVVETLRSAFESKAVVKRKVPQPKNWPEFPTAR